MKKIFSVVLTIVMLISVLPIITITTKAASVTKETAVEWALGMCGKYWDYDGLYGAQCVDLMYYYYDYLGAPKYWGNANTYTSDSAAVASGWQCYTLTSDVMPQPGDIAVWKPNYSTSDGYYYTGPNGHVGIVTSADSTGVMTVNQRATVGCAHEWFPREVISHIIRPNFISSNPVTELTIQNANYPITKPTGQFFEVFGTVSSPNYLEWVQCYVTNTAGNIVFWGGWGYTDAEKSQNIKTYNINALDSRMTFASLSAGNYVYHVDVYDRKGYYTDVTKSFTVGDVSLSSGSATATGRHMHDNDFAGASWGSWTTTKSATCTATGTKKRTCYCGEIETQTIAALGHTYDDDYDADCNRCGEIRDVDGKTFYYENLRYMYLDDGTLEVIGYETEPTGELVIPSTVYGATVTSIGEDAFNGCLFITNVTIPDGVTSIGEAAFRNCLKLTNVTIPNSVTNIGAYAFGVCRSLSNIRIPYGVKSIGNFTFYTCDSLTSITIPKSVTTIGNCAFDSCDSLTDVWWEDNKKYEGGLGSPVVNVTIGSFNETFTSATQHYVTNSCDTTCNNCSATRTITHNYNYVETPANCTKDSYRTYTCTVCGNSYILNNAYTALGHSYESVVTAPTCIEAGFTTYTCSVCGDSYTADEVNAMGHSYNSVVTLPTTTAQGYTTHTCANCGDSYKDSYTPALTSNGVKNMQITANDTSVTVTWDALAGATKYNLYVNDENGNNLITRALSADKTSVSLSWPNELEWDKNYVIGIRAKTTKWLDTVYKDAALVVGDRIVDVKTQSVGRTIKVDWKAYEGATQYYVYVYEKGAYPTTVTSVKATTNSATIINTISPETDYEVRVIATKGVTKMKTTDALSVDARLNVFTPDTFTERGITPNRAAVSFDEVRGADKYWVYLTPVDGGETIVKAFDRAIAAVSGLVPNTVYNVQLQSRIVDANGVAHYSGKSNILGTITTSEWEDINFTATSTDSGASLTWTAPTNAYKYIIYRSTNGGKSYKAIAAITDPATTSCVDTAAKSGYMYAIVTQLQDDYVTTKSSLVKAQSLDGLFEEYTNTALKFNYYFNSTDELSGLTADKALSSIIDLVEPTSVTEVEGEYTTDVCYTYTISDLNAFTSNLLNYTWDYSTLDGQIIDSAYECSYNATNNTISLTTPGGWGGPSPYVAYEGYTQVDGTHFIITYDRMFEGEIEFDNVQIEVELIDNKYVIVAHYKS